MHIQSLSSTEKSPLAMPRSRNLPTKILKAFDNAKHIVGLPRSVKDTLAELCRYVPQAEPYATIFAGKYAIAKRIGASERTVHRHLDVIKAEGLIEVFEQERKSRNGRFSIARIRLTKKAAELLGFVQPEIEDIHSQPNDKMSDGHTLTKPTCSNNQPAPRFKNGIPIDLCCLTSNGMSRAGVFGLMKKASSKGKRLSDIVQTVFHKIKDMKGNHLYAYLLKLALGPTCFALAAQIERKRLADEIESDKMRSKAKLFRERFAGVTLTNRKQDTLFMIDSKAKFVQVISTRNSGTLPLTDLTEWIKGIESGSIILATLNLERSILSKMN